MYSKNYKSQRTEEVVKRGFSMENKIIFLKSLQIVLTLAFIWHLLSLNQFCGTFADPKAFLHDISLGHCKSFTLIGKDSKSGKFGVVFDHHKWHNQMSMISTNGRPIEEQQHQFMDELVAKLPPAGRHCIPIMITPFDWFFDVIGIARNPLKKLTLFNFSKQLNNALFSLSMIGIGFMKTRRSVEEYGFSASLRAYYSVACWCLCAAISSKLLFYWTDLWTCVNFQTDHTVVPLKNLVISIVMVCLYVFELKGAGDFNQEILHSTDGNPFAKVGEMLRAIGISNSSAADCANVAYVSSLIGTRAAHLCACGLAAILNRMQRPRVTIGVDGSVFRFHPTFKFNLDQKIKALLAVKCEFFMVLSEDGSGRGAAVAAAVALRMNRLVGA
ncbi:hypothetical protein niasHT_019337 [Heterodera trifolii]|uniref:Phosphotransferase n=1 Tax=Heterodera trifolii TaxID=157864 RepID=A0ABD2L5P0_9BILA